MRKRKPLITKRSICKFLLDRNDIDLDFEEKATLVAMLAFAQADDGYILWQLDEWGQTIPFTMNGLAVAIGGKRRRLAFLRKLKKLESKSYIEKIPLNTREYAIRLTGKTVNFLKYGTVIEDGNLVKLGKRGKVNG